MKVLLAEDSESSQMLIKAYIEDFGHEVVAVKDGQQAVEAFQEERPDLVIMDVIMPVMDGIEATKSIRKICDQKHDWVPIVFLSALNKSEDILKGIAAGGDDYLVKPVDPIVLNAKIMAMARIADMRYELDQANRILTALTVKDGLTGLFNRRYFDEFLDKELRVSRRLKSPLSLFLCDIDHFKLYNDHYGHQLGDTCLKVVSRTIQQTAKRPGDVVARYGGEEFAVVLPETDLEGAMTVAESVREAVEKKSIHHEASKTADHVTLSIGVASIETVTAETSIDDVIHTVVMQADKALYDAKSQGRNQVVAYQD